MERDLAVLELQQALRAVLAAAGHPGILYPDGFFGPETERAVRLFQQLYGFPETGEVDQPLWEAVSSAFRRMARETEVYRLPVFPNAGFVMQPGSAGELVAGIQRLLREVSRQYGNIPSPAVTGVYDGPTEAAVRRLQQGGGLPETGKLDRLGWNLLVALLDGQM